MSSSSPTEQNYFKSSTTDLTSAASSQSSTLFSSAAAKEFVYDYSYWSICPSDSNFKSQQDVFNNLGVTSVQNALDGYNTCICAYGQTGSGKSYSMMGSSSPNDTTHEGLIPRMCKSLFERIKKNDDKANAATYRIEVSYLEIYNEKVRDLLRSSCKLSFAFEI